MSKTRKTNERETKQQRANGHQQWKTNKIQQVTRSQSQQETNNTLICIKQSERTETNNHTTTKRKNEGNRKNNITEMRIETRRQGKQWNKQREWTKKENTATQIKVNTHRRKIITNRTQKAVEFDRLNSKRTASDSEYAKTIQTHQSSEISKDEIVTQSNRPVALRHTNKQTQITNNTTHKHTQTYANKLQDKEPN